MFISHSVLRTPSSPLLVQYSKKFEVSRPPTFPTTQKRKKGNEFSNPPFFSHVWTLKNKRGRFPPSSSSSSFWVLGVQINFLTVCDDTSLVPSLKSRWAGTREQHSEPVFLCCCPTKPSPKKSLFLRRGRSVQYTTLVVMNCSKLSLFGVGKWSRRRAFILCIFFTLPCVHLMHKETSRKWGKNQTNIISHIFLGEGSPPLPST